MNSPGKDTEAAPAMEDVIIVHGEEECSYREAGYIVGDEIGRGGMGTILEAEDPDLLRQVAMKVLHSPDPVNRSRFVEEAQITGQLEHPNIVPVHRYGTDSEGRPYFTMKRVQGRSLEEAIEDIRKNPRRGQRRYNLAHMLHSYIDICNAIAFAHARGVIHRDLKPANIMLGDFGEVLVMDWGLAKSGIATRQRQTGNHSPRRRNTDTGRHSAIRTGPETGTYNPSHTTKVAPIESHRTESVVQLTMAGHAYGTPLYMSPEQARGENDNLDQRTDIYALGAILYQILTLYPPVKGKEAQEIMERVARGDITPPEERAPQRNIPPELSAIAMKALAPHRRHRYQTVEALRDDVARFLEGVAVSAKDDAPHETLVKFVRRNLAACAVFGVSLALLTGLGGYGYYTNLQERHRAHAALTALTKEQEKRRETQKRAAPAFLKRAYQAVIDGRLEEAFADIETAVDCDPYLVAARILKAEMLTRQDRFDQALEELEPVSRISQEAAALARLCRRANGPGREDALALLQKRFAEQDLLGLLDKKGAVSQAELYAYRKKLNLSWGHLGNRNQVKLYLDGPDKELALSLTGEEIDSLEPLRHIPLKKLSLNRMRRLKDLSPLSGTALRELSLSGIGVDSLESISDIPLRSLVLAYCPVKSILPLKGMPLESLSMTAVPVKDLTPIKGKAITRLQIHRLYPEMLETLYSLPLQELSIREARYTKDFSFLAKFNLTVLHMQHAKSFIDLTVLKDMPLGDLGIPNSGVTDLTPLQNSPIRSLEFWGSPVKDYGCLASLPLTSICLPNKSYPPALLQALRKNPTLKTIKMYSKSIPAETFFKRFPVE